MAGKTAKAQKSAKSQDNADVVSLQVTLPQLLDLALGTPEVGAVNLNILHNFLHVLLHQINLRSTKVEYRGDAASRVKSLVSSLKAGPNVYLHEYSITDASGKAKHRAQDTDQGAEVIGEEKAAKSKNAASAPATAREKSPKKDADSHSETGAKKTKGVKQKISAGNENDYETVIFVEPVIDGATPTALGFKQLEKNVQNLQEKFQALEELSSTPEIMERLKGKVTDPLSDMWHIINMNKRLDASEQGIDKLTSMVQDVMKNTPSGATVGDPKVEERIATLETNVTDLKKTVEDLRTTKAPAGQTEEAPKESANTATLQKDMLSLKTDVSQIKKEVADMSVKVGRIEANESKKIAAPTEAKNEAVKESTNETLERCMESVKNVETMYGEALHETNERVETLEKEMAQIMEKLNNAAVPGAGGDGDLNELVSKIQEIQSDMSKLHETADNLMKDRETRTTHFNAMLEQIELLKTIKADKEDLEDALADKADARVLNRKVSHDQFDAACDDLARGLEDAISKLSKQESIWQQALDEVQKEIEGKVDKIEITPLREFVNKRLKSLQEKLKIMLEMKRESEAAGTKKILRDVQCISCDKEVVMRMEDSGKHEAPIMPCTTSMKPYLTYELDQVRKQRKRLPHSRNMIQYEAAIQEETRRMKSAREEPLVRTPRDHLCNRYCGGSHTVTTPQQRVMRLGHFLAQWGPETVQLTEGLIKGTDGKLYRSRMMPEGNDVCGVTAACCRSDVIQETEHTVTPLKMSQVKATVSKDEGPKKVNGKKVGKDGNAAQEQTSKKATAPEQELDFVPDDPTAHSDMVVRTN